MNAERQRRYRARLNANPQKRDEYLMKQRLRRKQKEVATTCETRYAIKQHETRHAEMKEATYVMPHNEPRHRNDGIGVVGQEFVYVTVVSSFHCSSGWTYWLWENCVGLETHRQCVREDRTSANYRIWYYHGSMHQPVFINIHRFISRMVFHN